MLYRRSRLRKPRTRRYAVFRHPVYPSMNLWYTIKLLGLMRGVLATRLSNVFRKIDYRNKVNLNWGRLLFLIGSCMRSMHSRRPLLRCNSLVKFALGAGASLLVPMVLRLKHCGSKRLHLELFR